MAEIGIINLWPRESECVACGVLLFDPHRGLPFADGEIVDNDYDGEWAGFDSCAICHEIHEAGGVRALRAHLKEGDHADP